MATQRRHLAAKAALAAGIVAIASLGDLRQVRSEGSSPETVRDADAKRPNRRLEETRLARADAAAASGPGGAYQVSLVPAIHARNPDVRFVYRRHVSRWM